MKVLKMCVIHTQLSLNYLIDRSIQHCRGFLDESSQADHNKSVEGMLYIHFDLLAQLSY